MNINDLFERYKNGEDVDELLYKIAQKYCFAIYWRKFATDIDEQEAKSIFNTACADAISNCIRTGYPFSGVLSTAFINDMLNYLREPRQEREVVVDICRDGKDNPIDDIPDKGTNIEIKLSQKELFNFLKKSISELPERQRQALQLNLQEFTYEEIAKEMVTQTKSIKDLKYHGRQTLKNNPKLREIFNILNR